MRHINLSLVVAILFCAAACAGDQLEVQPPRKKTQLELDAEAAKLQKPAEEPNALLILLVVGGIAVPVVVFGLYLIVRNEPTPPIGPDDRAERPRPKRSAEPGQPVAERPGLKARLEPYLPATSHSAALPGPDTGSAPPFFLVRAIYKAKYNRMARIYVLPEELLVIDAGPGGDMNAAAGVTAAVLVGGGIIGSFIGGAVAEMVAEDQRVGGEAFQRKLDRLNLKGLLQWSTEEGNFRARFDELIGLSIDPSFRFSRAAGTFRFRLLKRGEYSFEFLCPVEIRGAIELLARAVGNSLHVGKGWDNATASYLKDFSVQS
jgi:hypothetical protein